MHIPKPLLPLGELPVIEIVIRQLASQGFTDVVVTTGFLGHLVEAFIGDGSAFGTSVRYRREESPLGTAAPIREVEHLEEDFLVLNGDLLTTLNFRELLQNHVERGAVATVAATRRSVHIDYGVVHPSPDGALTGYEEKPTISYAVSMGVYALSRRIVRLIPAEGRQDMPELIEQARQDGGDVRCHVTDVYWQDIGRFDDYQSASADFAEDPLRFLPSR